MGLYQRVLGESLVVDHRQRASGSEREHHSARLVVEPIPKIRPLLRVSKSNGPDCYCLPCKQNMIRYYGSALTIASFYKVWPGHRYKAALGVATQCSPSCTVPIVLNTGTGFALR